MVTIVLLNVDLMWAWPCTTFFFSRLRAFFALGFAMCVSSLARCVPNYFFRAAFFLPAIVFFGPLRVRALVCVRCPRTGRLRRWRMPW